jgi:ketosteroid isomerase-like protein
MSQENVEIVRRAYESQAEGRLDDWFEFLDRDIEWRGPREFPDLVEPHFGHEGVARYIAKVNEAIDVYRMAPEQFIDASSDQVLVFSREGERGRGSGAEVQTHPTAHPWTIRDGKAVRMQSYWERPEALRVPKTSSFRDPVTT